MRTCIAEEPDAVAVSVAADGAGGLAEGVSDGVIGGELSPTLGVVRVAAAGEEETEALGLAVFCGDVPALADTTPLAEDAVLPFFAVPPLPPPRLRERGC